MRKYLPYISVAILAIVLFTPLLGSTYLFDILELDNAEIAREMLLSNNWANITLDFKPFIERLHLFAWMQACSFSIFGLNEFAARLPNAIAGICSLLFIFWVGYKYFGRSTAYYSVLMYAACLMPHIYFKSAIAEPWYNLFIAASMIFLHESAVENRAIIKPLLAGTFLGLAVLMKGLEALGIIIGCILFLRTLNNMKPRLSGLQLLYTFLSFLFVLNVYLLYLFLSDNHEFFIAYINYQLGVLKDLTNTPNAPWYTHFIILLLGCFPASVFAIDAFKQINLIDDNIQGLINWLRTFLLFNLLLFTLVPEKFIHYSSICYFPIVLLAAFILSKIENYQVQWSKKKITFAITLGVFIGIFIMLIPLTSHFENILKINFTGSFAKATLNANVPWHWWESIPGLLYIFIVFISFTLISFRKIVSGVLTLLIASIVLNQFIIYDMIPKIQTYYQGSFVTFCKEHPYPNNSLKTIKFESSIPVFYGNKKIENNIQVEYYISKISTKDEVLKNYPDLQWIGEENGYMFWRRNAWH